MAELNVTATPGTQNINMVVTIKAPLEKVFKAYTTEDLVVQWWSQGDPFKVDYYQPVTGGKWRFVTYDKDGNEYAFHGCIHEVSHNERLIQTFEFEGLPESGHVALERADFKALSDNETQVTITSTFQSVEDRDGMVASGMESGFRKSIEALGRLIENS
jgi:uncharacterized protein YndB with AHSA1/START domain